MKLRNLSGRRPANIRHAPRVGLRERASAWWQQRQTAATDDDDGEAEVEGEEATESRFELTRIAGAVAAVVCVGLVIFVVANFDQYTARTQQFHVAHFAIKGATRVKPEAIEQASLVHLGSSLMAVDRVQVQRNIEKLPWVRTAHVQEVLPSTLAITVTEYKPYALLLDKKMMVVDRAGFIFKEAEADEASDLPIITGLPSELVRDVHTPLADGEGETVTQRRLRDLLHLIEAHAFSPLAARFPLSEVHWDPVLGTTLISAKDGAEVRFGHAMESDLHHAFQMVARLLDTTEGRKEWLKYALLDDELRPDRAVVQVVKVGQQAAEAAKAGGAAGERLPGAAPGAKDPAKADGQKTDAKNREPGTAAAPHPADEHPAQDD